MPATIRLSVLTSEPFVRQFAVLSKFLYEDDCRFDATTYSQDYYVALHLVEACRFNKVFLKTAVGRIYHPTESQPRSNFKRIWATRGEGPPFLTGRQLFFFRPEKGRFLSRRMEKLSELLVPEGTILLSRSGTTGYPVLVGRWLSQFAVTDDAIRIFEGTEPIGFVYAFLASRTCRALLTKNEYGSTVSHLEAKHVGAIRLPLIPKSARDSIHERMVEACRVRDAANSLLDEADKELHDLVGVLPFEEGDVPYLSGKGEARAFSIRSSEVADRFDATHHVPLARTAIEKLSKGCFTLVQLGERVESVYVAPRFARTYVEADHGTPLLQGSHVPLIRPHDLKYISNSQTVKMDRWIIRAGWVLVTCSGTIGRTAVATRNQDGWAASQHILRIVARPNVSHEGFLSVFLSTPFGQHQLNAKVYGGVVDELTEGDTEQVWIPDVPYKQQEAIGQKVVEAYEMRDQSNLMEDGAIAELEALIRLK